ncbi:MAG TPA: SigB/SigF/SigG family RNA polymerase sigma factor [Clostridia bacterium]
MLEHNETIELIARAQKGDEEAKTKLLVHNAPLIKSIIRRYVNKGVDYDDLYQLGSMGFLKAIKNFDTSYNVKFSTYAVPMIAGEVKRFLRDDGYIKVSRTLKMLSNKINQYIEEYKKNHASDPTIEELAKKFNMDPQEIVFAMDSAKLPMSLYEKNEDPDSTSLIDKISSQNENTDEILDKLILTDIINELSEREKKIIIMRYFRDKTQSEIAVMLGVSQVQVSRLESKIIQKIKNKFFPEKQEKSCK